MAGWLAGVACQDVTPPPGSLMGSFPTGPDRTPRRATGAHDPCLAQSLALSDGRETVVLCAVDIPLINGFDTDDVKRLVGELSPELNVDRILISASHTHHGPETTYVFRESTPDDPWMKELRRRIALTIHEAIGNLEPARIGIGLGEADLIFNRRVMVDGKMTIAFSEPPTGGQGPVDPTVGVLRVDREDGSPLAIVVNYAAHALVIGPGIFEYTADFPGAMRRHLERTLGTDVEALFLIGAAGNLHPKIAMTDANWDQMETMGRQLAEHALSVYREVKTDLAPTIRFHRDVVTVPNRVDNALNVDIEIGVLRLGDAIIGFVPTEFYVEFQLAFRRASPSEKTLLLGGVNGSVGYVPNLDAYQYGGYGVDDFVPPDPPAIARARVPSGTGEIVVERLISMANAD